MKQGYITVLALIVIFLAAPLIYTASGNGLFGKTPAPELEMPTNATECVEEEEWMRKNHMNLLLHQREDTVREGVRDVSHSLSNCKTCHRSREKFCDQCHEYVGIKPDCFSCHYYP